MESPRINIGYVVSTSFIPTPERKIDKEKKVPNLGSETLEMWAKEVSLDLGTQVTRKYAYYINNPGWATLTFDTWEDN